MNDAYEEHVPDEDGTVYRHLANGGRISDLSNAEQEQWLAEAQ